MNRRQLICIIEYQQINASNFASPAIKPEIYSSLDESWYPLRDYLTCLIALKLINEIKCYTYICAIVKSPGRMVNNVWLQKYLTITANHYFFQNQISVLMSYMNGCCAFINVESKLDSFYADLWVINYFSPWIFPQKKCWNSDMN